MEDNIRFAINTNLGINVDGGYVEGFETYADESLNIFHFDIEELNLDSPYINSYQLVKGELVFDQDKYDEYMSKAEEATSDDLLEALKQLGVEL